MPSTVIRLAIAAAPATAVTSTTIGMPAVQTARKPVTVGSLRGQHGSCRTSTTAGLLQQQVLTQQGYWNCKSRTPATAGGMQNQIACNSRDASNHSQRQQ
jgi:hypothetical protein